MRQLVLASTSPYRKQLLQQLGLPFVTASPLYFEELDQEVAPELLVKHLALHKAESLRKHFPEAVIIGADQVFVDPRRRIHGKPGTPERAVEQLKAMAGRSHTFYTGIAVCGGPEEAVATDFDTFSVTLRDLSDEQIRSYVERENPVDCAGSFKIEGLGITLMDHLDGRDYTTLIGLPLIKLTRMLEQFDIQVL